MGAALVACNPPSPQLPAQWMSALRTTYRSRATTTSGPPPRPPQGATITPAQLVIYGEAESGGRFQHSTEPGHLQLPLMKVERQP
jgi:hypothetical protein